jgi:MOSC domain-containing protein YiiM
MRVVSVNVGFPRTARWKGRDLTTGIFKQPVRGIPLRRLNLDGDRQADLSVYGGAETSVYGRTRRTQAGGTRGGMAHERGRRPSEPERRRRNARAR